MITCQLSTTRQGILLFTYSSWIRVPYKISGLLCQATFLFPYFYRLLSLYFRFNAKSYIIWFNISLLFRLDYTIPIPARHPGSQPHNFVIQFGFLTFFANQNFLFVSLSRGWVSYQFSAVDLHYNPRLWRFSTQIHRLHPVGRGAEPC